MCERVEVYWLVLQVCQSSTVRLFIVHWKQFTTPKWQNFFALKCLSFGITTSTENFLIFNRQDCVEKKGKRRMGDWEGGGGTGVVKGQCVG